MASCADSDKEEEGGDVSCAVCLTSTQDPRRLPCGNGHVFCLSCLQGLVTHGKTVQDGTFPCPCCRNRVTIPRRGVAAFPSALEAESGSSGSSQPRPRPPSAAGWHGGRPRFRPRHLPHNRAEDDGFYDRGDVYMDGPGDRFPPRGPLLPFPRPRRPMNSPFFPVDRFNPRMNDPEPSGYPDESRERRRPVDDFFRRRVEIERERPFALSSILSGAQPSLSSEPGHDRPRPDPDREAERRRRRDRYRVGQGAGRRPPGHLASFSDDLDMDEVLLVIAQMEQQEQLAAAGHHPQETLRMEASAAGSEPKEEELPISRTADAQNQQEQEEMLAAQMAFDQRQQEEEDEMLRAEMVFDQRQQEEEDEMLRAETAFDQREQEEQEEMVRAQMAFDQRQQEQQETLSLQTAVARSHQDQRDMLNLQTAIARSEQDAEEMMNLQMALIQSEHDQEEKMEIQFQEDRLKSLRLH